MLSNGAQSPPEGRERCGAHPRLRSPPRISLQKPSATYFSNLPHVIVMQDSTPSSATTATTTSAHSFSPSYPTSMGTFRLQPRGPVCTPSSRGRKRNAAYLSEEHDSQGADEDEDASSFDVASHQFLATPPRRNSPLVMCSNSSFGTAASPGLQNALTGLSLQSPCSSLGRSSFTRYSPPHYLPRTSPCAKSPKPVSATGLTNKAMSIPSSTVGASPWRPPLHKTNHHDQLPHTVHVMASSFDSGLAPSSQQSISMHATAGSTESLLRTPTADTTPLPRLNLTPRSSSSTRSWGQLPIFPTELNFSKHTLPESRRDSAASSVTSTDAKRSSGGSFIPLPDWGEPQCSLLSPRDSALEVIINHQYHHHQHRCDNADDESLSADEDAFFLAAPSVIREEKRVSHHAKQQRKFKETSTSNTSLFGMDFVTSSNNLRGMDDTYSRVSSPVGLILEPHDGLSTPPTMPQPHSPPPLSAHTTTAAPNNFMGEQDRYLCT
jgi:hypothetical protein